MNTRLTLSNQTCKNVCTGNWHKATHRPLSGVWRFPTPSMLRMNKLRYHNMLCRQICTQAQNKFFHRSGFSVEFKFHMLFLLQLQWHQLSEQFKDTSNTICNFGIQIKSTQFWYAFVKESLHKTNFSYTLPISKSKIKITTHQHSYLPLIHRTAG